jgi:hypothetical protein
MLAQSNPKQNSIEVAMIPQVLHIKINILLENKDLELLAIIPC